MDGRESNPAGQGDSQAGYLEGTIDWCWGSGNGGYPGGCGLQGWVPGLSSIGDKAPVMLKEPFVLSEVDFAEKKPKATVACNTLGLVQALKVCFKALVR